MSDLVKKILDSNTQALLGQEEARKAYEATMESIQEKLAAAQDASWQAVAEGLRGQGLILGSISEGPHDIFFSIINPTASPRNPINPEALVQTALTVLGTPEGFYLKVLDPLYDRLALGFVANGSEDIEEDDDFEDEDEDDEDGYEDIDSSGRFDA
jgi:hypothetical protein